MFMFLPFLIAMAAAIGALAEYRKPAYAFWALAWLISLWWFKHHATSPLDLSF